MIHEVSRESVPT